MTNSEWGSRLPVRGCTRCQSGYIIQANYHGKIPCNSCKGTGIIDLNRNKSVKLITDQITKNLKDGHRSEHRELFELRDNGQSIRISKPIMAEKEQYSRSGFKKRP